MYGLARSSSKCSPTCSRSTAGANGRNDSRNLIFRFSARCISRLRGSARIDRLPSARGPNSMRPCIQPTTAPSARCPATRSTSAARSRRSYGRPCSRRNRSTSSSGPRRPKVGARHAVALVVIGPAELPLAARVVPGEQCCAERPTGIARRGLDPDVVEDAFAHQQSVRHAVERHAAREAQVALAGLAPQRARQLQHDLVRDELDRRREIHRALVHRLVRLARRPTEQRVETRAGHAQAGRVLEEAHVEPERAVGLDVDEVAADQLRVARLAIGREAHHLVLARVHPEAGVRGEGRIEQARASAESAAPSVARGARPIRPRPRPWPTRRRRRGTTPPPTRTGSDRTPTRRATGGAR